MSATDRTGGGDQGGRHAGGRGGSGARRAARERAPRGGGGGAAGAGRPERPYRPGRPAAPGKPQLPEERSRLPRDVYRDLKAASRSGEADDVAAAYGAAGEALADGRVQDALELLEWAKSAAARSAAVREALGVARYHAGDFAGAQRELLAYRRLSGRHDQNHLLADCARATGHADKVVAYVDEMVAAGVTQDRCAEGAIVLAGARADRGDFEGALHALDRVDLAPAHVEDHHVRVWYLAADLSERAGDPAAARDYLEAVAAVDPDFLDVTERLDALTHSDDPA